MPIAYCLSPVAFKQQESINKLLHQFLRTFVHDLSVVGADDLAVETAACDGVDDVPIDLAVAIDDPVFAGEALVLDVDVEGVGLGVSRAEFAAQVFVIHPKPELVGVVRIVPHPIIEVVVRDAGTGAEWDLPTEVGEKVQTIVVMVLRDGQLAVQHHPVDQVRQLAHSASDSLRRLPLRDGKTFFVALPLSGTADALPDGEGLAGTNQQPVNVFHGQGQIGGLVLLQLHVDIAQSATDKGVVPVNEHRQCIR